jgi:hypothetical protein
VRGRYEEIRALGAEVLVVSFEPVERLPRYREWHGWPFPVVADPTRDAYRAFGLESASLGRLLRPGVVLGYAALMLRGHVPRPSAADVRQLGGDFVVGADRRLAYAHRSADPADRPPAEELVRALRASRPASAGGGTG